MTPLFTWRTASRLSAPSFLASLLLLPQCVIGNLETGAPFKPDAETLLLAQFEEDPYRATYANGWGRFAGSGAPVVAGYYGKGIDLTGRALAETKGQPGDYAQWAFWPKGNLRYDEGTVEFWFRTGEKGPAPLFGDSALFFYSIQQLRPEGVNPEDKVTGERPRAGMTRTQATLRLNRQHLLYKLVTVGGKVVEGLVDFRKTPGFERMLKPDEWHHFALTWADGAMVFYIDGNRVAVHDITGEHGLALVSATQRPIAMSGLVLDELRISSVARYRDEFEPNWRDGTRPAYAFNSTLEHPEIPTRYTPPILPSAVTQKPKGTLKVVEAGPLRFSFDPKRGDLARLETSDGKAATGSEGLQLRFDVERTEPTSVQAEQWKFKPGKARFVQRFDDRIEASHSLEAGEDDLVRWRVSLKNSSAAEQRLEVRLGIPVPGATVSDYFDGSGVHDQLSFPRRRDEYIYTLPFVAASGDGGALGLGVNPNINLSSLISEWVPVGERGVIRQGTRLVLAPGESFDLEYLLVPAKGSFGSLDALDRYHAAFGELYRQVADVPIYSYMPVAQHFKYMRLPDLARQFYIGNQWGHGPYHTKGDYMGSEKYWKNPKYQGRVDYAHGERHQQLYGTIENLRRRMVQTNKDSFDYYYTLRRSHDVPNLTPVYIVRDVYPKFDDKDDPLVAGQYYLPTGLFVNEFKTPLGKKFIDDQVALMKLIGRYSPGFINDMCQISPYRFVDEIARKSPGRAFSADRGTYLVGGFGHVDRYRKINEFMTEGHRQSMWSDFGMVSYMLSAHSSANAFEAGERFWGFSSLGEGFGANRFLLGEKPTACLVSYGADQLGLYYSPEEFTPASLREYYRRNLKATFLLALRQAVYLDPPYLHGHQWMTQANPVLIESMVHGRKLVSGAKVDAPLWVVRGGSGWDSLWAVGNETAEPVAGTLTLERRYFDDAAPVVARYYGGRVAQTVGGEGTKVEKVKPAGRDFEAFKAVAAVTSPGQTVVTTALTGDGLGMQLVLETDAAEAVSLRLNPFEALYELKSLEIDGKRANVQENTPVDLPAGKHRIVATYSNKILRFSSKQWANTHLIKDGKTNFRIVGKTQKGFDHGTAVQLNFFLQQYDEEDGVVGNLSDAPIDSTVQAIPEGYEGWKVILEKKPSATAEVTLDEKARQITMKGATSGELRKAMMVFLRLLDRKYPHVGRPYPLREVSREWESEQPGFKPQPGGNAVAAPPYKRIKDQRTVGFFKAFEDPLFPTKPVLEAELEPLFENNNNDFSGRYRLAHSPWLFEPTLASNYVYGYDEKTSSEESD